MMQCDYKSAKKGISKSNAVSRGVMQGLIYYGAPLEIKFTYKKRSAGRGMWACVPPVGLRGWGPDLYKHKY